MLRRTKKARTLIEMTSEGEESYSPKTRWCEKMDTLGILARTKPERRLSSCRNEDASQTS